MVTCMIDWSSSGIGSFGGGTTLGTGTSVNRMPKSFFADDHGKTSWMVVQMSFSSFSK